MEVTKELKQGACTIFNAAADVLVLVLGLKRSSLHGRWIIIKAGKRGVKAQDNQVMRNHVFPTPTNVEKIASTNGNWNCPGYMLQFVLMAADIYGQCKRKRPSGNEL
ncbi:hypothetical protein VNO80_18512 [Phaseolus coccineus]|uniref:Uncharacterized protein n=1 Tax=Phaseolus coccineus TaxID=3886 RepID=A0AAN9QZI6_PHACN